MTMFECQSRHFFLRVANEDNTLFFWGDNNFYTHKNIYYALREGSFLKKHNKAILK